MAKAINSGRLCQDPLRTVPAVLLTLAGIVSVALGHSRREAFFGYLLGEHGHDGL